MLAAVALAHRGPLRDQAVVDGLLRGLVRGGEERVELRVLEGLLVCGGERDRDLAGAVVGVGAGTRQTQEGTQRQSPQLLRRHGRVAGADRNAGALRRRRLDWVKTKAAGGEALALAEVAHQKHAQRVLADPARGGAD